MCLFVPHVHRTGPSSIVSSFHLAKCGTIQLLTSEKACYSSSRVRAIVAVCLFPISNPSSNIDRNSNNRHFEGTISSPRTPLQCTALHCAMLGSSLASSRTAKNRALEGLDVAAV